MTQISTDLLAERPRLPERPHRPVPAAPRLRVWDLPTRLFKWSLVAAVTTAWVGTYSSDPNLGLHKAGGYAVLVLVTYRVLWGFFGGSTARFGRFLRPASEIRDYLAAFLAKREPAYLGHNPAGGLMIVILLVACGLQALAGLFVSDGVTAAGPFADAIGEKAAAIVTTLHKLWFYGPILVLVALHVGVNLYHQVVKRDNLIGAMITGSKPGRDYADGAEVQQGSTRVALLCFGLALALVYGGIRLAGGSLFTAV